MSAPVFEGCERVLYPGLRCVLGSLAGGGYALWLLTGGQPAAAYPATSEGWDAAYRHFAAWETPPKPPQQSQPDRPVVVVESNRWAGVVVLVVIFALAYFAYHIYRYHGCLITPGWFTWPSRCG